MKIPALPLGPTLLVAAAVPAMLAAGVWQLHRLEWKEALLARLATAPAMPVLDRPDLRKSGLDFRRAVAECAPTTARPRIQAGRSLKGEIGFSYILTCAQAGLSLNAGWSARPDAKPFRLAAAYPGMLREHDGPRYVLITSRAIPPLTPSAPPSLDEVPNSHLSYAIQWFSFATVLMVIYGIFVWTGLTSSRPYRARTWWRGRTPDWLFDRFDVFPKGDDCEKAGGEHDWYNSDGSTSACYHCRVTRDGQLWRD